MLCLFGKKIVVFIGGENMKDYTNRWVNNYIKNVDLKTIKWIKFSSSEYDKFIQDNYLDKKVWQYVLNKESSGSTLFGMAYLNVNHDFNSRNSYLLGIVDNNIGKKNNQNFILIPHSRLIQMIEYKCNLEGITVVKVNEAYTSKCSFLDNEQICKHQIYKGNRIKRGLFRSSKGIFINADINGAYNIMILGLKKLKCNCDAVMPADMRFVYNPAKVRLVP